VFTSADRAVIGENAPAATVVYDAEATDPEGAPITFSLLGADAQFFSINATSGEVRFLASPDYEAPKDANKDNVYDVVVHATDGVNDTAKAVAIQVANNIYDQPSNLPPTANADVVLASFADYLFQIPDVLLLRNDTDPNGDALTIGSTMGGWLGAASHSGTSVTFNFVNPPVPNGYATTGFFSYQVWDGQISNFPAEVTVYRSVSQGGDAS
jgi:serralysin